MSKLKTVFVRILFKPILWMIKLRFKRGSRITFEQSREIVEQNFTDDQLLEMYQEMYPDTEVDIEELKDNIATMTKGIADAMNMFPKVIDK